jgi:flagellar hook-associated protein 3 FlgL
MRDPGCGHLLEDGVVLRVTNQILFKQALGDTQKILGRIEQQQRTISSGLRVQRPSDDPAALGGIMRSSSSLRALEQYQENLASARARLSTEHSVLDQLTNTLIRAKELAVAQGGSASSPETRAAAKAEVDALREHVIGLANTQFAGSYMFAGDYADTRPFSDTGIDPARPPTGELKVEGGAGAFYLANHNGQEIFVDSGILDALENLSLGLENDSDDDIRAAITDLDTAFKSVQGTTAELGARMTKVDTALENLSALEVNLRTLRSDLQDADIEEAVTELVNQQVTYQAAMLANSRILSMTLTDYLR